jgi:hypothetical protein
LREQIELCTRGPEWNAVMDGRLKALQTYENKELLLLSVYRDDGSSFFLRAHPDTLDVVYWDVC